METEATNIILVTGFGPFGEHIVNASWEAVSSLPNEINAFKIVKEQIPVAYKHVEIKVPELWKLYNPKLVVHVGVTSYSDKIQIESCANKNGYTRNDIFNSCPSNGAANCIGEDCIKTNICTKRICDKLNQLYKLKACVSENPGRYLCEFIYYTSLNIDNNRSLFVHVPPINKPYSVNELALALEEIIKCALDIIAEDEKKYTCFPTGPSTIYKNGRAAAAF